MRRYFLTQVGLAIGIAALTGCKPQPQAAANVPAPRPVAVAAASPVEVPPPVAPPAAAAQPVALAPPAAPVSVPTVSHSPVTVVQRVVHRRWVHKYYAPRYASAWMPQCGSDVHPCNVEHVVLPIK